MNRLPNLRESQFIKIWQYQLLDRTGLVTEEGEPLEIVYPGRLNDDRGADFRDAVIATRRGLVKGDIEIHVNSGSWREHRHHRDASYNRVVLHVVMWHNTGTVTRLQNGGEVPILALHKYLKVPPSQPPDWLPSPVALNVPCLKVTSPMAAGVTARFLDKAGEERFLAKAARFQADLTGTSAGQSLYQGIMGALGYAKNELPFLELARSLPLPILESMAQAKISAEECLIRLQALLLGAAGLLPSQRQDSYRGNSSDDEWTDRLERLWASFRQSRVIPADTWRLFRVRPNNSPVRRLAAVSYLIFRCREKGILEELVGLVKEVPVSRGSHRLEKALLVSTDGYWASHFDFGSGGRLGSPVLLGCGRAADIIVNVLLPFTFAWSRFSAWPELGRKALDLYRNYPRLAVNSVERHMTQQLGLSRSLVNSAQRQQGLLHIYNSLCTQGRCNHCVLSQLEAGHHV